MTEIKDREVEMTVVIEGKEGLVTQKEVVKEASEDETERSEITINRFVAHWCGHYKTYGYSCGICQNRLCRACQESGRIWYCEKCGVTIGPCCYRKRYDEKILCPEHWKLIDWKHPAFKVVGTVLGGVGFLGGLGFAIYLLNRLLG